MLGIGVADPQSLRRHIERTIALNPEMMSYFITMTGNLTRIGRYSEALTFATVIAQLEPGLRPEIAKIHVTTGNELAREGNLELSFLYHYAAHEAAPDDPRVHEQLATAYLRRNRPDKTAEHLEKALELDPSSAVALNNLALLRASEPQGGVYDPERALQLVQQMADYGYTNNHHHIVTFALAYESAGNIPEALKHARRALEVATDAGDAMAMERYKGKIATLESAE